jgi:dTDP-4-amino-4,6-dideoxygalactose transaminase
MFNEYTFSKEDAKMNGKTKFKQLAIFGNAPAFREPLHVGRPNIPDREIFLERVVDILESRWLTNRGPYVKRFEEAISEYLGVEHCVVVANATLGLALLASALDLSGEVVMPAFTFVATPHALKWQKLDPVFCDVDPHTHNIDPRQVKRLITPATSAILGVHVWGRPCDTESLEKLANDHNLAIFYDAAHAFGCTHRGKFIGNFGSAEVFSFHATKFLHSFEGGAITTNDGELAERLRCMKNFGFDACGEGEFLGLNAKMPEVSAAMGLTSLENIDNLIRKNQDNYHAYQDALAELEEVSLLKYDEKERRNYQFVVIDLGKEFDGPPRDLLMRVLHAEGVLAKRYFHPGCHRVAPYKSNDLDEHSLKVTEKLADSLLALPTGDMINRSEINMICSIIKLYVQNFDELRRCYTGTRHVPMFGELPVT